MEKVIIVAATHNRVIGKDNDLIWNLPVDMNFFKEQTKGFPVIMGRKNYESIPHKYRPLPGRKNIILSRQSDYPVAEGVTVATELKGALERAEEEGSDKAFIIGGGQIYSAALEAGLVDRMLITWVDTALDGDAFFPEFEEEDWEIQTLMYHPADDRHQYGMKMMEYTKK